VRTGRWAQACPGWRDDLAAYLVGALDPQACTALRHHLGTCPACQAEYEDLLPVVGWLALLTSPGPGNMGLLVASRGRAEATCNITH
jgi:Putative zinc-finger